MRIATTLRGGLAAAVAATALMTGQAVAGQAPTQADERAEIAALLAGDAQASWVFAGDSITQGGAYSTYSDYFDQRVREEMGRGEDTVTNSGVSGDQTGDILADWDDRVTAYEPDVVSIMFGMNDAAEGESGRETYRDNLITMVQQVRDSGAIPVLQTQNPINGDPGERADFPAYMDIMREMATAEDVVLIDHNEYWQSLDTSEYYTDELHPNGTGHIVLAKKLLSDLDICDENNEVCSYPVE